MKNSLKNFFLLNFSLKHNLYIVSKAFLDNMNTVIEPMFNGP